MPTLFSDEHTAVGQCVYERGRIAPCVPSSSARLSRPNNAGATSPAPRRWADRERLSPARPSFTVHRIIRTKRRLPAQPNTRLAGSSVRLLPASASSPRRACVKLWLRRSGSVLRRKLPSAQPDKSAHPANAHRVYLWLPTWYGQCAVLAFPSEAPLRTPHVCASVRIPTCEHHKFGQRNSRQRDGLR